ncbi:MAG: hypothetical protein NTV49_05070 [Kiritimatiellaeota bacterium]|nr:hypothetical protein [Kiritimatiellota bacterium]
MNEIANNLTSLGVIATIVAIIFAGASLAISSRRKAHQQAQQTAAHPPPAPAPTPTPLNLSARVQPEEPPRPVFKRPAPAAAPVAPPPAEGVYETGATSSPLFKRLGRVGGVENTAGSVGTPADHRMDLE